MKSPEHMHFTVIYWSVIVIISVFVADDIVWYTELQLHNNFIVILDQFSQALCTFGNSFSSNDHIEPFDARIKCP